MPRSAVAMNPSSVSAIAGSCSREWTCLPSSTRRPTGLNNLGNTCYMNAALQCLLSTPALADFLSLFGTTLVKRAESNALSRQLKKLLEDMNARAPSPVSPIGVLSAVKSAHPMFRGFQQHDAQEFLRCIMDTVHEELVEARHLTASHLTVTKVEVSQSDHDEDDQSSVDEEEEEYETADSGLSDDSDSTETTTNESDNKRRRLDSGDVNNKGLMLVKEGQQSRNNDFGASMSRKIYGSIISDVFDGKLVSSVQCLACNRVSSTQEAFQDLSLPIPSPESLLSDTDQSWSTWFWTWLSSWFSWPTVTLDDCLAHFFMADELKGDNMYSCERCRKLRNGLKYSRVTVLPDTLCIHLKRFRHEFCSSSKISTRVTFPLVDLDMATWMHDEAKSRITKYDLSAIICHHGYAGGGHYTAYAINEDDQEWYEFDDSYVGPVEPATVMNAQAYVLFYRKNSSSTEPIRREMQMLLAKQAPSLVHFFVSKQWLNKLENIAEPGKSRYTSQQLHTYITFMYKLKELFSKKISKQCPIDNSDFLCQHGGVLPHKVVYASELCIAFPQQIWQLLHSTFGGGPACTKLFECALCKAQMEAANRRRRLELETFKALKTQFQDSEGIPPAIYCLSSTWFRCWETYVTERNRDPPSAIDNRSIITRNPHSAGDSTNSLHTLRAGSDYLQISPQMWHFFKTVYGGGPEVVVNATNGQVFVSSPETKVEDRMRTMNSSWSVRRTSSSSTSSVGQRRSSSESNFSPLEAATSVNDNSIFRKRLRSEINIRNK